MKKSHVNLLLEYARLLGDFTGTLQGILWWDIPKELEIKLRRQIKELKATKVDTKVLDEQELQKERADNMAECLLSLLDSLKLQDQGSLRLGRESLSEMMFRKMKSCKVDLNKELGFTHLKSIPKHMEPVKKGSESKVVKERRSCTCKADRDNALYCPVHRTKGL